MEKNNKTSRIGFFKKHPIITTIILLIVFDALFVIFSYQSLGSFTNHDEQITVPDLQGLTPDEAANTLSQLHLQLEVSDSTFIDGVRPGSILEQNPKAGVSIKANRQVYVTIRTFATKLVSIPSSIIDNSVRQGESLLKSMGVKNIRKTTIPSEYADLIYEIKWNGTTLHPGDKIPVNATVTLVIGDGSLSAIDTIIEEELWPADAEAETTEEI